MTPTHVTSAATDIDVDALALDPADASPGPGAGAVAAVRPSRLADYYELTKPRMNFLVVVTTAVGYYMAVRHSVEWVRLVQTIVGTFLTAAGASVLNQFVERDHDARMPRTANRPLPAGRLAPREALVFGVALGALGVATLALLVNPLTAFLGLFTLATYVFIYTPMKRFSTLNTVVGAIPGAIPPVMGFAAVHGTVTVEALALFGVLFVWQMPHFLAIAILYRKDYAAGGFLMLPVVDESLEMTGRQIVLYAAALVPVSLMPVALHMAGPVYFTAATLLGLGFLTFGISCATSRTRLDARRLFLSSIMYLPLLLAFLMFDKVR